MDNIEELRDFLKDTIRQSVDFAATHQSLGVPPPPVELAPSSIVIHLPHTQPDLTSGQTITELISKRQSRRVFSKKTISLDTLSFLLWATQGVRAMVNGQVLRTVPSAGNRHPMETYLVVFRVEGLEKGIYRYLPLSHSLTLIATPENLATRLTKAALRQSFVAQGAVTFIWAAIPYRTEWRYAQASHKVIAIDAGHICQNLYLACESVHLGTCAIAAYDQKGIDQLVGIDGQNEFVVYMAPVGPLEK